MAPLSLLPLTAATFEAHDLHRSERAWTETNCYVDVWIELLHALDLEPLAAAAFPLSSDFEGDQWTFFKFPPEDLRAAFGLEVAEFNVWRPVVEHVVEQLELGRLCTVEVDAWFLPDTRGVSYRVAHTKTTIVPQAVDVAGRHLGYFHNAGYFELGGDDFDGVFRLGAHADPDALPPYVETIRLDRVRRDGAGLVDRSTALLRDHLGRRPTTNPVERLAARLEADRAWLAAQDLETFHLYAFGTCRQCGAANELAASFCRWVADHTGDDLDGPAAAFTTVAEGAKTLQFALARISRGRSADLSTVTGAMAEAWQSGMDALASRYGD
jgi:hypothetical protein